MIPRALAGLLASLLFLPLAGCSAPPTPTQKNTSGSDKEKEKEKKDKTHITG